MKKVLNICLLVLFIVTLLVPLTGIVVHKIAAALFLLLCIVHTIVYRKKLSGKKYLMISVIFIAFISGLFGMIFDTVPLILAVHKIVSIGCVFILAVHIFVFGSVFKFKKKRENCGLIQ